MLRRTDEAFYHSVEGVSEHLEDAIGILARYGLEPEQNDATLAAIVNLLASKQVVFDQVSANGLGLLR